MEEAAKRYARRILLLHLLVLAAIVAGVVLAAREVHQRASDEVIRQAARRQELLASQTARAIENHYASILSNLDLIKRGEQDEEPRPELMLLMGRNPRAPLPLAPLLWHQLEGRVSHLFGWRPPGRVFSVHPREQQQEAQQIVDEIGSYLHSDTIPSELISPFKQIGQTWGHLVITPLPLRSPGEGRMLLVAVVPTELVRSKFLDNINRGTASQRQFDAIILDEDGIMMAGSDAQRIGDRLLNTGGDPAIEALTSMSGPRQTLIYRETMRVNGHALAPRMVTGERVTVGGRTWTLVVSSRLADLNELVGGIFRSALWWSVGLVIAVTTVLVSTSTQMIRARLKVEQLRNELLGRELDQARQIQLAWLPQPHSGCGALDIAAVNEPASHISGDFYDWFDLPDGRSVVTIGDVTGHGMAAAFLMATTQLLIRNTMQRLTDPGKCLTEVNRQLCAQVFNGQFVTVLVLVLDPAEGRLRAASAGHFPPVIADGQAARPLEMEGGLVMGIDQSEVYATTEVELPERFAILLYTDGTTDVPSNAGPRYGSVRLHDVMPAAPASAQELLDAVVADVKGFGNGRLLDDDLTLVAVCGEVAAVPASA